MRVLFVLALEFFGVLGLRLFTIAVMRLVIEHDDVLEAH